MYNFADSPFGQNQNNPFEKDPSTTTYVDTIKGGKGSGNKGYFIRSEEFNPGGNGQSRADVNRKTINTKIDNISTMAPPQYTRALMDGLQDRNFQGIYQKVENDIFSWILADQNRTNIENDMYSRDREPLWQAKEECDNKLIALLDRQVDMTRVLKQDNSILKLTKAVYILGQALQRNCQHGRGLETLQALGLIDNNEYQTIKAAMGSSNPIQYTMLNTTMLLDLSEATIHALAKEYKNESSPLDFSERVMEVAQGTLGILHSAEDKIMAEKQIVQLFNDSSLLPESYKLEDYMQGDDLRRGQIINDLIMKKPISNNQNNNNTNPFVLKDVATPNIGDPGTAFVFDPDNVNNSGAIVSDPNTYNNFVNNGIGQNTFQRQVNNNFSNNNQMNNNINTGVDMNTLINLLPIGTDGQYYVPITNMMPDSELKEVYYEYLKGNAQPGQTIVFDENHGGWERFHFEYTQDGRKIKVEHRRGSALRGTNGRVEYTLPNEYTTAISPYNKNNLINKANNIPRNNIQHNINRAGTPRQQFDNTLRNFDKLMRDPNRNQSNNTGVSYTINMNGYGNNNNNNMNNNNSANVESYPNNTNLTTQQIWDAIVERVVEGEPVVQYADKLFYSLRRNCWLDNTGTPYQNQKGMSDQVYQRYGCIPHVVLCINATNLQPGYNTGNTQNGNMSNGYNNNVNTTYNNNYNNNNQMNTGGFVDVSNSGGSLFGGNNNNYNNSANYNNNNNLFTGNQQEDNQMANFLAGKGISFSNNSSNNNNNLFAGISTF